VVRQRRVAGVLARHLAERGLRHLSEWIYDERHGGASAQAAYEERCALDPVEDEEACNDLYGNVTTADFIALAERVSDRQLDALFDAWLYQEGRPAACDA
jgi:hypothetical protein